MRAIEYQPVAPAAENIAELERCVRPTVRIHSLLELFLTAEHYERTVIWHNGHLPHSNVYHVRPLVGFRVLRSLDEAWRLRETLEHTCLVGHINVLFIPKEASTFREELLGLGHYVAGGSEVAIAPKKDQGWLKGVKGTGAFFASDAFSVRETAFAFTHDADYLLEIRIDRP